MRQFRREMQDMRVESGRGDFHRRKVMGRIEYSSESKKLLVGEINRKVI